MFSLWSFSTILYVQVETVPPCKLPERFLTLAWLWSTQLTCGSSYCCQFCVKGKEPESCDGDPQGVALRDSLLMGGLAKGVNSSPLE